MSFVKEISQKLHKMNNEGTKYSAYEGPIPKAQLEEDKKPQGNSKHLQRSSNC